MVDSDQGLRRRKLDISTSCLACFDVLCLCCQRRVSKPRPDFRLIDAQLESSVPAPVEPVRRRAPSPAPPRVRTEGEDEPITRKASKSSQPLPAKGEEMDDDMKEMEKFLPMLTESLGRKFRVRPVFEGVGS